MRYGWDRLSRLWCSWLITASDISIYFPGDTAVGPHFAEVRELAGKPIDLALMPIGPTEPARMMRTVHLNAQDTFDMSEILQARKVYPIHWGAFSLGEKPAVDDIVALRNVWRGDTLEIINVGYYLEWNGAEFVLPDSLRR
jgi:L-ascorbate metabolism protein UlaG (beta-lactamase superfamily)